jgi:hypothetical protein
MIRKAKGLELIFKKINWFEHIWFKCAFDFKNYGFWKCDLNKSYSYLFDNRHECIIYMIWNQFVVKMYLYLTCNVKLGIQNTNCKL